MSEEQKKVIEQSKGYLQALGIILLFALIVLDAFLDNWELPWPAYVIVGFFALGARPETVAGIFGVKNNDEN